MATLIQIKMFKNIYLLFFHVTNCIFIVLLFELGCTFHQKRLIIMISHILSVVVLITHFSVLKGSSNFLLEANYPIRQCLDIFCLEPLKLFSRHNIHTFLVVLKIVLSQCTAVVV